MARKKKSYFEGLLDAQCEAGALILSGAYTKDQAESYVDQKVDPSEDESGEDD